LHSFLIKPHFEFRLVSIIFLIPNPLQVDARGVQNKITFQALFSISKVNAASGGKDFLRLPMVNVSA